MSETINHPAHYGGDTPFECVKVIESFGLGFSQGNSLKYLLRAGKKGDAVEDKKKGLWYLERALANEEPYVQYPKVHTGMRVEDVLDAHSIPKGHLRAALKNLLQGDVVLARDYLAAHLATGSER